MKEWKQRSQKAALKTEAPRTSYRSLAEGLLKQMSLLIPSWPDRERKGFFTLWQKLSYRPWLLLLSSLTAPVAAYAADEEIAAWFEKYKTSSIDEKMYAINFNNISITEYIRFVSKILGLNFIFNEADLQFNITLVSEEPVSARNIISALIQVLRVYDFNILEQDNNLLITKSVDVNQIATIVSDDAPTKNEEKAPILTRVFRVKNAKVGALAAILKPLLSKRALLEASVDTQQLIVTDIATNIDKISQLLISLDMPHSSLEIDSYIAKTVPVPQLVSLAHQILSPFAEGQPLIFVPYAEINTIFIVSTPFLIEKALATFVDLDISSQEVITQVSAESIFVYKPEHRSPYEILRSLTQVAASLQKQPTPPLRLISVLSNAQVIDNSSIVFIGDQETLTKLKEILATLDTSGVQMGKTELFIYKIQEANEEQIENSLNQIADNLSNAPNPDQELMDAIHSMRWIKETNSLVFTGSQGAIAKLKELLPALDVPPSFSKIELHQLALKSQFFIYNPKYRSGEELMGDLLAIADNLKTSGLADPDLLHSLNSARWVGETNSLIFTGNDKSLGEIKNLLSIFDVAGGKQVEGVLPQGMTFYLYKLQYVEGPVVIDHLKQIGSHLKRSEVPESEKIIQAIDTIRWIQDTNSLMIVGTPAAIDYLKQLITQIDQPSGAESKEGAPGAALFTFYKPQYQTGPQLISILKEFEQNLIQSGVIDQGLFQSINNLKWIEKTNSLLISGTQASIDKVMGLLERFDVPSGAEGMIESIENTSFLIYKLQYHRGEEITSALKQIATDITSSRTQANKELLEAVNSLQWIKITNSLIASGQQETLTKLKTLIENLDVPLRQVFIEVLVIKTTLDAAQNIGLQWGGKVQYLNKWAGAMNNIPEANPNSGTTGANFLLPNLGLINATRTPSATNDLTIGPPTIAPNAPAGNPNPSGFDLGVIGDIILHKGRSFISLGSLINALQQDSDSTVIINPKIVAQDTNNSTIFVGQNIPFTSSFVNNVGQSTVQTTNVEYRDVGVSLSITPTMGNGDVITLDIVVDISAQTTNTLQAFGGNLNVTGLQTAHTNLTTHVHVPDNHFVVLSGAIQDSNTHFKSSIPCLGGLPLIGAAFSNNERSRDKNNVVFFMRPRIITTYEEFKAITEHQEELYKEQAFLPVLQEDLEAGIDIIKSPENE